MRREAEKLGAGLMLDSRTQLTVHVSFIKRVAGGAVCLLVAACAPTVVEDSTQPPRVETGYPQETARVVEPTPTVESTVAPTSTVSRHMLYYECEGEGIPAIMIESGLGEAGTNGDWRPVMEGIKGTTRICTYDRVNLGRSDRVSSTRTSQDIVDDLRALLESEGIEGPYILVGHSLGGFHVRLFAETYPDQVSGMLLLDSTHPDHFALYAEVFPTPSSDEPPSWARYRYAWTDTEVWADNPEHLDFAASANMVRETGPFGDLPLIVLAMDPAQYDMPSEITAAVAIADDRAQQDLAALSTYTQGHYSIVPGAGHFIHVDQPQVVIDALLELIATVRNERL